MRFSTNLFHIKDKTDTVLATARLIDGIINWQIHNKAALVSHLTIMGGKSGLDKNQIGHLFASIFGSERSEGHLISPLTLASSVIKKAKIKRQLHNAVDVQHTLQSRNRKSILEVTASLAQPSNKMKSVSPEMHFLQEFLGCKKAVARTAGDTNCVAPSILLSKRDATHLAQSLKSLGLRCAIFNSNIENSLCRVLTSTESLTRKIKTLQSQAATQDVKLGSSYDNYAAHPYGITKSVIEGTPVYVGLGDWPDSVHIQGLKGIGDCRKHVFRRPEDLAISAESTSNDTAITIYLEAHGSKENAQLASASKDFSADANIIGKKIAEMYPCCTHIKVHLLSCYGAVTARKALANGIIGNHKKCQFLHVTASKEAYYTVSKKDSSVVARDPNTTLYIYRVGDKTINELPKGRCELTQLRQSFKEKVQACEAYYRCEGAMQEVITTLKTTATELDFIVEAIAPEPSLATSSAFTGAGGDEKKTSSMGTGSTTQVQSMSMSAAATTTITPATASIASSLAAMSIMTNNTTTATSPLKQVGKEKKTGAEANPEAENLMPNIP